MSARRRLRPSLPETPAKKRKVLRRFILGSERRSPRFPSRVALPCPCRAANWTRASGAGESGAAPRRRERVDSRATAQLRSPAAGSDRANRRDNIRTLRDRSRGSGCDGSFVPPVFRSLPETPAPRFQWRRGRSRGAPGKARPGWGDFAGFDRIPERMATMPTTRRAVENAPFLRARAGRPDPERTLRLSRKAFCTERKEI